MSSVNVTLNSTASRAFRIELFANATGNREGQRYLGFVNVTTSGTGIWSGSAPIAAALGEWVTATATDSVTGDTSEFGAAIQVTSAPVNNVPGPQAVNEDSPLRSTRSPLATSIATSIRSCCRAERHPRGDAGGRRAGGWRRDGRGTITGTQGAINSTLASLAYQGNPNFNGADTLTMTSTDAVGLQDIDTVAITVSTVDDLPQINDATAPALPENSANGTAVYIVNEAFTGTDNDRDGQPRAPTRSPAATPAARLRSTRTGAITVANSAALDFETTPAFTLTVRPPMARCRHSGRSRST